MDPRLKLLRSHVKWCLDQDWSYGNHGPPHVPSVLRQALEMSKRPRKKKKLRSKGESGK